MTKERTTHTLLAAVVALLGLHLALRLSPQEATAQVPAQEPQVWASLPPQAVSFAVDDANQQIYRLWSDGTVEWNRVNGARACSDVSNTSWCGWVTVPG